MEHRYSCAEDNGGAEASLQLVARARQFSSFLLLLGRIETNSVFSPSHAIILSNKDEVKIPLLLEVVYSTVELLFIRQIPSAQEFKDAIESLSPEQQNFAKAIRAMQLSSSLFGVCVLQIKPQIEKLLRLPSRSLKKELQLAVDILELLMKYQITSDMLT